MGIGLSFGKKKTSQNSTTNTNVQENSTSTQNQTTTGTTNTNTTQQGQTSQSTQGLTSADQVNRQNQTTTGSTNTTGTTTTLSGEIQNQLESSLGALLGGIGDGSNLQAAAGRLADFDADSFINNTVNAASYRGEQTLQETNSALASAIGGTASDNSMAALLAQRGANDLAANLAGVRANATQTANEIARGNLAAASGVNQAQAGTAAQIGELLKGATTTSNQSSLQEQLNALIGSQVNNQRTNEQTQGSSLQSQQTSQLVNEIIAAINQSNSTKVGTEQTTGTTKQSGGGISASF